MDVFQMMLAQDTDVADFVGHVLKRYEDVFVILAPPRCSSTALARVFWEQPSVGYYLHEPFDQAYYGNAGIDEVLTACRRPIELKEAGRCLVIKEMTFQVGRHFHLLAEMTSSPVVFIIRDPRLSGWSRMKKLRQGGQEPVFPERESGWGDLRRQIAYCEGNGLPYVLLDSTSFRNSPQTVLPALFETLGLPFSPEMLQWEQRKDLQLGNLGDQQDHWYERVLESTRLQPATSSPPSIEAFPEELRPALREWLEVYRQMMADENLISS